MRCLIALLFCFVMVHAGHSIAGSLDTPRAHVAIVTEVLDGGGYTYIHYKEGDAQGWIAMPQIAVNSGEWIEFPVGQPMYNFKSATLGRTFDEICFIPGLRKVSRSESLTPKKDDVYQAVDDEGTVVFTDDPSKIPAKKNKRNKEQ